MPESDARSVISTRTFRRALTASVDSGVEIKSTPSVAKPNLAEVGGRCRKAVLGVCVNTLVAESLAGNLSPTAPLVSSQAASYFPHDII